MQCPFCQEDVGSEEDLQLHCLVNCTAAYAEPGTAGGPRVDSVVVRFRWEKELRPCIEREVHLISSLAGSVILYRKEHGSLYESESVGVPVGQHTCQLVVGGDVIPTEDFEVNEESDIIFVIVKEAVPGSALLDDTDHRRRLSAGDVGSDSEPLLTDTRERPWMPLDLESREGQNGPGELNEMSPLYRELLQHQLSHGEPSWVPGSGAHSPVMADVDLRTLPGQQDGEPPILTTQPPYIDELRGSSPIPVRPGVELERRSAELSGESDGEQSLHDGGAFDEQGNGTEEALASSDPGPISSSSPVPSSHSGHDNSRASSPRGSPVDSVLSETGARDGSAMSPLLDEDLLHESPPPDTAHPSREREGTYTAEIQLFGDETHHFTATTSPHEDEFERSPSEVQNPPFEHASRPDQSSSRASPLGSVLDAVLVPVTDSGLVTSDPHASQGAFLAGLELSGPPPERTSPAGSVQSSSLFSSGLPSPLASPRVPSQSDTVLAPAERGSPSGSNHNQTQPPLRPQSLGGSFNISEMVPTSVAPTGTAHSGSLVESQRGSISGVEQSPTTPNLRQSPTGSVHSTSYHPSGLPGVRDSTRLQHQDSSHHSSHRSTPVQSGRSSAAATPPVVAPTSLWSNHHDSQNRTPSGHRVGHRGSGAGSPSELLMEAVHRRGTSPAHSRTGSSRASERQSPALSARSPSERSSPRVVSPPWTQASGIPSHESAFVTVNGEQGTFSKAPSEEVQDLRRERDTLVRELKQRTAHFEAELRRVKSRNVDLEQQMLSIETVATLTKHDDEKAHELEQRLMEQNRTVEERGEEINRLQDSVRGLERANQLLKEEHESLKTVNSLRLDDMNKINSALQEELSALRRRSLETARTQRGRDKGKIMELQVLQKTLEQHIKRLEFDNTTLQKQLNQTKQELETVKAQKSMSDFRLSKAKSETDLSRKFERFTSYDKHKYGDPEPPKTVSFAATADSSRLGTSRYTSPDTNYTRAYQAGTQTPVIMNGHGSARPDVGKSRYSRPYSSLEWLSRGTYTSGVGDQRRRVGSLGDESDVSDDVEPHGLSDGSHRRRTFSSESSTSSVVSWDHDFSAADGRQPRADVYDPPLRDGTQQDGRTGSRRRRPHSYHGAVGSIADVYSRADRGKSAPASHLMRGTGEFDSSPSSSYSTHSPLLTTATYQTSAATHSRVKLLTKPFAPSSSEDIQIGMEVLVTRSRGQIGRGVVKYVGPLPSRKDTYIGVELGPGQEGKHDGSLDGRRLFLCKPNRGIFVSFNKVVMCYG